MCINICKIESGQRHGHGHKRVKRFQSPTPAQRIPMTSILITKQNLHKAQGEAPFISGGDERRIEKHASQLQVSVTWC